jgi:hypothetical protein
MPKRIHYMANKLSASKLAGFESLVISNFLHATWASSQDGDLDSRANVLIQRTNRRVWQDNNSGTALEDSRT